MRDYIAVRVGCLYGAKAYIQGEGVGTQPLPNMPGSEKGLSGALVYMSETELIREVQDLDDDQLYEALGPLQTKTI